MCEYPQPFEIELELNSFRTYFGQDLDERAYSGQEPSAPILVIRSLCWENLRRPGPILVICRFIFA